jgi:hypothetical protein
MDVQEKISMAIKSQGKIPMIVNHSVLKRYNIQSIQYGCHRDYAKKKLRNNVKKHQKRAMTDSTKPLE